MIIFNNIYLTLILFLVGGFILQYLLAGILYVICEVIYVIGSIIKILIKELIDWIKEKIGGIFNKHD